jgi:hypothetical protein
LEATSEAWISEFFDHVLSPSAVGDFVLTVLGAGVAFVGAVWLFRRQLQHDRDIFRGQIEADRELRVAEMRRAAAHRLGEELIAASNEFESLDDDEVHALLVQRGFDAVYNRSPGAGAHEAHKAALYELDLDNAVITVWSAKLRWWEGAQALMSDARLTALTLEDQKHMLFNLVEDRFVEHDALLRDLGTRLIRWDGVGEIPTIPESELPERISRGDSKVVSEALDKVMQRHAERRRSRSK